MPDDIGGLDELETLISQAGSNASADTIHVDPSTDQAAVDDDQTADTIHLDGEDGRGGADGSGDSVPDGGGDGDGGGTGSTVRVRRHDVTGAGHDDTVRVTRDDTVRLAGGDTIHLVYGDTVSAAQDRTQRAKRRDGSAADVSRSVSVSAGFVAAKPVSKPVTDLSKLDFYPPEVLPGGIAPYPVREQPVLSATPSWVDATPDVRRMLDVGQLQGVAKKLERRRRAWRYRAYATVGGSTIGGIIVLAIGIYLLIRG